MRFRLLGRQIFRLEVRIEEGHKMDDTVYSYEMQQELHFGSEVEENGKGSTYEMHQELPVAGEMDDSSKFSNSAKSSGPLVECFEKPSELWISVEVNPNPAADDSAKPAPSHRVAVHESVENRKPTIVYKSYVRRNKRKREEEAVVVVDGRHSCSTVFTRSPCEGLRPRTGRTPCERVETKTVDKMAAVKARKKAYKEKGSYECDLEGCHLRFRKRAELLFHKRNRCTYKGCRKRFSSHRNAARHQRRHDDDDDDERPLKCPWKGCNRSFKWAWARTEHVRLHTGERPYTCKFAGCGLTFRFISEFSRHRRKTGHFVGS